MPEGVWPPAAMCQHTTGPGGGVSVTLKSQFPFRLITGSEALMLYPLAAHEWFVTAKTEEETGRTAH